MSLSNIVVLISGYGSNLQAVIDAIGRGEIHGKLCGVISDQPDAYGLRRAQQAGIPTLTVAAQDFTDSTTFNQALSEAIESFSPQLVVLAGFMRILQPEVVRAYAGRMINIHPSLLPKYRGLNTHQRVLEAGDTEHGTTVHFVTEELDGGPIIAQATIPVEEGDDADSLKERIHIAEHTLYPKVISWFCDGRLQLAEDGHVYLDNKTLC